MKREVGGRRSVGGRRMSSHNPVGAILVIALVGGRRSEIRGRKSAKTKQGGKREV